MDKTKTILYLINGLGVASKDSFDIKFNDMMPNLSMLMGNYIYSNIQNVNYSYKNAFKNFSLGQNLLPTYDRLEKDTEFSNNKTVAAIANDAINNKTKVQLYCFLDNEKVSNHVVKIINTLTSIGTFPIYIHIVLRQKDIQEYDNIIKLIKIIDEKITLLNNVSIGTIVGERQINEDKYYELITKQNGEKWPDYSRKLNYANQVGTTPRKLEGFYMHEGFKIETNDISLFLNYEDVDCNEFINRITNVKLYTLFPMKAYSYAINIYDELPPTEYFSKVLDDYKLKCLVLTTPDRVNGINYNLCGLKEIKSPYITYMDITDKNLDKVKIIENDYDLIIYDYDIGLFKEIGRIKDFLMTIDDEINELYKTCDQKGYNLYISSLYGMYRDYIIGVDKKVILDYSIEVPVIAINPLYPASKFALKYGDTHMLSNTIFAAITNDPNFQYETLYRKKGIIGLFKE